MYEKYYFATIRLCNWFRVSTLASGFNRSLFIRSYSQLEIPMSISANYPALRPALLLDFANSQQLDSRVTFSRSTTAPYYDGKTSVLAEQNLVLYSQDFTNAAWAGLTSGVTVVGNNATAPDGTTTADTATFTGSSYRYQFINTGVVTGVTYTFSVWISSLTGKDTIGIRLAGASTGSDNNFSLVSLTTTPTRISVTRTFTSSDTQIIIGLDNRTAVVGGGQTTGDVIVWGAQLEQRSSATAYNATTTTALTNYIPQLLTAPINAPRFDFNPTTGESLGLLIEQSSTNLLTYSQDFSNAVWTKLSLNGTLNVTGGIAIDGTQSANLWQENTTASTQRVMYQTVSATSGVNYTLTVYAKQYAGGAKRWLCVYPQTAASGYAVFDLTLGTVTLTGGANYVSSSIAAAGNGFYRCSVTVVAASTASLNCNVYMQNTGSSAAAGYTGDGFSGIYIWGAQVEALAFPTSYIPTTSAQVTRASDNASMTGTNFSSWYNISEGTIYSETSAYALNGTNWCISDGTSANRILSGFDATYNLFVSASGVTQAQITVGSFTANTYGKVAGAYKTNDFAVSLNASLAGTDTLGVVPAVNQLQIGGGAGNASGSVLNGRIKKISYYPIRVTNTQLQSLTGS